MHAACMATKTISEAHRRLSAARRTPKESFSQVIHRACWEEKGPVTGVGLLDLMRNLGPVDSVVLDALEAAQKADLPPADRWEK
jgi:predicted CopG family antitoxin